MQNIDQVLFEAGLRYRELLAQPTFPTIAEFAAQYPREQQAELREYLEDLLQWSQPVHDIELTADEETMLERVHRRVWQNTADLRQVPTNQTPVTLVELRQQAKLSVSKLAHMLNLPVSFLGKLERGGIALATIPQKFMTELAQAIQCRVESVHAALTLQPQPQAVQFNANDQATQTAENIVSFADGLRSLGATPAQLARWEND